MGVDRKYYLGADRRAAGWSILCISNSSKERALSARTCVQIKKAGWLAKYCRDENRLRVFSVLRRSTITFSSCPIRIDEHGNLRYSCGLFYSVLDLGKRVPRLIFAITLIRMEIRFKNYQTTRRERAGKTSVAY